MTTTRTAPVATTRNAGTITLGRTTYTVTEVLLSDYVDAIDGTHRPASSEWHLAGPRGATYFLRGYMRQLVIGQDDGVRQVISWTSGQPLRVKGNEVRVVVVGDVIEQYVPTTRG